MHCKIVFTFLVALSFTAKAQTDNGTTRSSGGKEVIPEFEKSIRGNFKLPNTFANNSFKKVFNGVSNVEISYIQPFAKNFFIGAGFQHSFYDINKFTLPEIPKGAFQAYIGFGEAGFQKYLNGQWYYAVSLRGGYGAITLKNDNCAEVPSTNLAFTEELFGIYMNGNERMSYGLIVSHQIFYFEFGPSWLCKENFSGLSEADYNGNAQTWTIGFGFTCKLGKLD